MTPARGSTYSAVKPPRCAVLTPARDAGAGLFSASNQQPTAPAPIPRRMPLTPFGSLLSLMQTPRKTSQNHSSAVKPRHLFTSSTFAASNDVENSVLGGGGLWECNTGAERLDTNRADGIAHLEFVQEGIELQELAEDSAAPCSASRKRSRAVGTPGTVGKAATPGSKRRITSSQHAWTAAGTHTPGPNGGGAAPEALQCGWAGDGEWASPKPAAQIRSPTCASPGQFTSPMKSPILKMR